MNNNGTEYHERHLRAFYQMYGHEDVKPPETPTQETQMEVERKNEQHSTDKHGH